MRSILEELNALSPMQVSGKEFNQAAEHYYRTALRRKYREEGLSFLEEDIWTLDARWAGENGTYGEEVRFALQDRSPLDFLLTVKGTFWKKPHRWTN